MRERLRNLIRVEMNGDCVEQIYPYPSIVDTAFFDALIKGAQYRQAQNSTPLMIARLQHRIDFFQRVRRAQACKQVFFSQFACDIFRLSLDSSLLPEVWKLACIIPIFKRKGKINQISNYRPITLSCTLLKVFERILADNILKHFIKYDLFDKSQFGFLPRRSTNLQLIYQLELWYKALQDNENIATVYVDLSKAFDSVNTKLLLKKLFYYGIRGKILNWLEAYLLNRKFYVKINNENSSVRNITSGVPQGSPLGPLLFHLKIEGLLYN